MSLIRVDRHLPPQLSIKLIDNILYLTGLSGKWVGERPKRFLLNIPLFITLFLLAYILLRCVSYRSDDRLILLFTADFGHLMGAKKFCNTLMILLSLMALSSLAIHYHNKFIGMKTTFNGLFEMLSGSRTPASVGLNDPAQVEQLLKIAKWLPLLKKNNAIFAPLASAVFSYGLHFNGMSIVSALTIGTYTSSITSLVGYYVFNLVSNQMFMFNILCKYIRLLLKHSNQLIKVERTTKTDRIIKILRSLNSVYCQIDNFNGSYWSKFLASIWFILGIFNVFTTYVLIYQEMPVFARLSAICLLIQYTVMYFLILSVASSVNSEANTIVCPTQFFHDWISSIIGGCDKSSYDTTEGKLKLIYHHYHKIIFLPLINGYIISLNPPLVPTPTSRHREPKKRLPLESQAMRPQPREP